MRVVRIVTHPNPHVDEIASIWAIWCFGKEQFPGVDTAIITFEGRGGEQLGDLSAEEWEAQGVLCIGVGGGRFDEHPGPDNIGQLDRCAFDLVVEALGIQDDPCLEKIIKFVQNTDLKASGHPFDLGSIVKYLYDVHPDNPRHVIEWAIEGFEAKYRQQQAFVRAQTELVNTMQTEWIRGVGENFKLVVATTDEKEFKNVAKKEGASIIVQRRTTGNVQIFIDKRSGLQLEKVAAELRKQEMWLKGKDYSHLSRSALSSEGKIRGAEEWYFHTEGQILLNGSISAPDVAPTLIPLVTIVEIVKNNIEKSQQTQQRVYA